MTAAGTPTGGPSEPNPTLETPRVLLRPLHHGDYEQLRSFELGAALGARWRFHGATPPIERYVASLNDGVLAQFAVISKADAQLRGLVAAYQPDFGNGFVWFAAASFQPSAASPAIVEAGALFIDYVFHCWPFRKIYLEVEEYNLAQFGRGMMDVTVEEGRLRAHTWLGDRYWDRVHLALYRDRWFAAAEQKRDLRRRVDIAHMGSSDRVAHRVLEACHALAGRPVSEEERLIVDLHFGPVELQQLYDAVEDLTPGYQLPHQMDIVDVKVVDVIHYARIGLADNSELSG